MNAWEKIQRLVYRPDFFAQRNFKLKSGLRFYALLILILVVPLLHRSEAPNHEQNDKESREKIIPPPHGVLPIVAILSL